MPIRAAIYARISSDKAGEGLGVQRQTSDCEALAARKGWSVADVLVTPLMSVLVIVIGSVAVHRGAAKALAAPAG